ncbi:MAG: SEC-C metal-binding domain-containing protein [Thiohalophilus sp.]|uniref:IS1096 element passenger TnpR family protein n=1 Tax=Thiohalophilus sp. TaxID=3028392 RepID=UPI00287017E0|nr:SEC-C metal-binding domain-containing protein [Thiohalophilus sp.]MDR9437783.1 SEC-C metal-binding domain-containing protein [Thiohalophilus sp.]
MNKIYRILVCLRHVEPSVWRRIEVTADTELGDLHSIIQIAMGWEDAHPHAFRIGKRLYGDPASLPQAEQDEFDVTLADLVGEGDTIVYDYDFGDGWEHELKIEQVLVPEAETTSPRCLAGEGACPPEDCGGPPGYANLLAALADPAHEAHDDALEWLGEEFDPAEFNIEPVNEMLGLEVEDFLPTSPVYAENELTAMSEAALFDELAEHGDRVPRNLIDECARRGDAMLAQLEAFLQTRPTWEAADDERFWLPLHAVMILGLMSGERAEQLLMDYFFAIVTGDEDNLQEWLAGYWPALMHNKPGTVLGQWHTALEDKQYDWYPRSFMAEVILAAAGREGGAMLEETLDRLARIAAEESEDWTLRMLISLHLLDFPRERHRSLLEHLADRQQDFDRSFDRKSIDESFARNTDQPDWERFANPWQFYDLAAIEQRQRRWLEEDLDRLEEQDELLVDDGIPPFAFDANATFQQPWQRQSPKVGRNDPCPCGSGKKYKKCCLNKNLH